MRGVCLVLLLLVPAASAQPVVSFGTPAQFEGDVGAQGMWALVYFHDSQAEFSLHLQDAKHVNHTMGWYVVHEQVPLVGEVKHRNNDPPAAFEGGSWDRLALDVSFDKGWSSLFIVADHLELDLNTSRGAIVDVAGEAPESLLPSGEDAPPFVSRAWQRAMPDGVAFSAMHAPGTDGMPLRLNARGVREVEWHNASTTCPTSCPDGAKSIQQRSGGVHVERLHYAQVLSRTGAMHGGGMAFLAVVGGTGMTADVTGSLRLPEAHAPACDCRDPEGSTLLMEGHVTLDALTPDGPGRVHGTLGGNITSLRFDEQTVDSTWLNGKTALTAAIAVGAIVVAPVLAWLFTRIQGESVLGQPTRRRIHSYIAANPGTTFNDMAQRLGISAGSVNYNLKVLRHRNKVTVYSFLNRSYHFTRRHDPGPAWQEWVLRRDHDHDWIIDWVRDHPGTTQTDIAARAGSRGVSRTALQKRLTRLTQAGLLRAERQGRVLCYQAA